MERNIRRLAFLFVVTACACGSEPAPPPRSVTVAAVKPPASAAVLLPYAENALDMIDAPVVVLDGTRITVDGVPAGDVSEIQATARLQRIDPLFDLLKANRARWKTDHPGASFPGVIHLRIAPSVKAVVVKSVFQTAAFAGYPNASFMVQRIPVHASAPPATARLVADALIPGPPGAGEPEEREKVLHVEVAKEKFVLVWKLGGEVIATVDIPRKDVLTRVGDADALRFPELASKISKEWQEHGQHRAGTDKRWDQAIVRVPDDAEHQVLVAVIDAVYAPKRPLIVEGTPEPVPAFNVTFAIAAATGRGGQSSANGRLAPETIQKIVRASFGKFRACYEQGLRKNADLNGRVAIAFVIELDGSVSHAADAAPDDALPDSSVVSCIATAFGKLKFPKPEGGIVKVQYPIIFNPGD